MLNEMLKRLWLSANAYKTSLLVEAPAPAPCRQSNDCMSNIAANAESTQTKANSDLKSQNNNSFMRCYLVRISSMCSNALCWPNLLVRVYAFVHGPQSCRFHCESFFYQLHCWLLLFVSLYFNTFRSICIVFGGVLFYEFSIRFDSFAELDLMQLNMQI